jgi:hypothetical protein
MSGVNAQCALLPARADIWGCTDTQVLTSWDAAVSCNFPLTDNTFPPPLHCPQLSPLKAAIISILGHAAVIEVADLISGDFRPLWVGIHDCGESARLELQWGCRSISLPSPVSNSASFAASEVASDQLDETGLAFRGRGPVRRVGEGLRSMARSSRVAGVRLLGLSGDAEPLEIAAAGVAQPAASLRVRFVPISRLVIIYASGISSHFRASTRTDSRGVPGSWSQTLRPECNDL